MKKRIGTKLYDTDTAICVLPEKNLYKQAKNRTFFTFDGAVITPLTFEAAAEIIRETGNPDLVSYLQVKPSNRGCATLAVTVDRYYKLERYAKSRGVSMKSVIEAFIDDLTANEKDL